jgi:hypothetical protein
MRLASCWMRGEGTSASTAGGDPPRRRAPPPAAAATRGRGAAGFFFDYAGPSLPVDDIVADALREPSASGRGADAAAGEAAAAPGGGGAGAALGEMELLAGRGVSAATLERWEWAYRQMAADARDLGIPASAIPQLPPAAGAAELRAARDLLAGIVASFASSGL